MAIVHKSQERVTLTLRLPSKYYPLLKEYAKDNDMTVNAALVHILRHVLDKPVSTPTPASAPKPETSTKPKPATPAPEPAHDLSFIVNLSAQGEVVALAVDAAYAYYHQSEELQDLSDMGTWSNVKDLADAQDFIKKFLISD